MFTDLQRIFSIKILKDVRNSMNIVIVDDGKKDKAI